MNYPIQLIDIILISMITIIAIIILILTNAFNKFKRDTIDEIVDMQDDIDEFKSSVDQQLFDVIDVVMEPVDPINFYKIPEKGSNFAAGYDIYWSTVNKPLNEDGSVTINPGETLKFGTNLNIMITIDNFYLDICPRSGMAINKNLIVINSPARIDSDYRGELIVGLKNTSEIPLIIEPQSRIAQCTLHREINTNFMLGKVIDNTDRSKGGLGHSGTTEIEKQYKGEKIL